MSAQDRGRWLVVGIIAATLLGDIVFVVLPAFQISRQSLTGSVIGCVMTAAILYALWRGYSWARWLLVALCVIGLSWSLWLASGSPNLYVLSRAVQLVIVILLLATSPSVTMFLDAQRRSRKKRNPMKGVGTKKELSPKEREELLKALKVRFEKGSVAG